MFKLLHNIRMYLEMFRGMITKPENFKTYWKEFIYQCYDIGIGSLGIISIISIFLGAVTTIQTAYQLVTPFIPKTVIPQVVRDSTILELSPTVCCVVLAGVVGSKISSELGNMRISEQIDAYEIMGVNSKMYLILPKILAALIMIPVLIALSMFLSNLGGYVAATASGIVYSDVYIRGLQLAFIPFNLIFALIKALVFAFIISSIACYFGYYVKGGALEIGKSSTQAVITSCILILIFDYVLSLLLLG